MSSSPISAIVQATSLTSLSSEESQLSVPPSLSTSILVGSSSSQLTGSAPAAIAASTELTASLSIQSVQGFSSTIDSSIATEPSLSLASPMPIGPTISPGSILPVSVSDEASSSSLIQPSGISSLPLEQSSSALTSKGRVANAPLPTSSGISSFTLEPSTSSVLKSTGSHELQLQSVVQSGSSIESFPVSSAVISTLSSSIEQPTSSLLVSTVSHELQSPSVAQSLSSIQSSRSSSVAVSTPVLTSKDRGAPLPTTSVIASPSLEQPTSSVLASTVSHEVQSQSAVPSVSSVQSSQLSSVAASTPVLISKSAIASPSLEQPISSAFVSTIPHEPQSQSVARSLSSVQSLQISSAAVSTPPPRSVARVGNALPPPTGEAEVTQSSEAVVLSSTIASSHTVVTASSAAPSASDSASAPAPKTSHDVPDVPSSIPSSGSSSGSAIVSSSAPPKSSASLSVVPPSVISSEHVLPPSRSAELPSAAPSTVQGSPSGQPVLSQKSAQISPSETNVRSPSTVSPRPSSFLSSSAQVSEAQKIVSSTVDSVRVSPPAAAATLSSIQAKPTPEISQTQATASQPVAQHAQANAKTPTATSTITDRPETTLSKPVFVSTTNSLGHSTVTIPPLITSLAFSTEADGSLVTVTHVVANPTGIWGIDDTAGTKHGFFANTGAVAGVFLVVGVVVASIAAIVGIVLCKRRRRQRIRLSISRPIPYPENPFEDPRDSPSPTQMRYTSNSVARNVVGTGLGAVPVTYDLTSTPGVAPSPPPRTYTVDRLLDEEAPVESQVQTSMAGIGAGRTSLGQSVYDGLMYNGPFSDYHNFRPTHYSHPSDASGPIGLAITMEDPAEVPAVTSYSRPRSRPVSPAPSTPSVYPATLPADDEVELERGNEPLPTPAASDDSHVTPVPHFQRRAPEIPPRNPLRNTELHSKLLIRTQLTPQEGREPNAKPYEPLTPPASISSEQSQSPRSTLVNPFSEVQLEMPQTPSNANFYDNFYTRRKLAGPELHTRTSIEWRR